MPNSLNTYSKKIGNHHLCKFATHEVLITIFCIEERIDVRGSIDIMPRREREREMGRRMSINNIEKT